MFTPRKRGAKIARWLADQKMREEEALIAETMRGVALAAALPLPGYTGSDFNAVPANVRNPQPKVPELWRNASQRGSRNYFGMHSSASSGSGGRDRSTRPSGDEQAGEENVCRDLEAPEGLQKAGNFTAGVGGAALCTAGAGPAGGLICGGAGSTWGEDAVNAAYRHGCEVGQKIHDLEESGCEKVIVDVKGPSGVQRVVRYRCPDGSLVMPPAEW